MDDGAPSPVTLHEVARVSGFSVSLVSRVLAGRQHASVATRDRILEAAAELGYVRSAQRRGRPRAAARLLDLAMGQFDDPWADQVVAGVRSAAAARGYDLVLTEERDTVEDDWPMRVRARGSAGVVLCLIKPTLSQLRSLTSASIPLVLLDPRSDPTRPIRTVGATDWQGGYDAGRLLGATDARRFVVVAGQPMYRFGRARADGFRAAIDEFAPGRPIEELSVSWSREEVFRRAVHLLGEDPDPIGVFAIADELAHGIYDAAEQLGLRIPADVHIVGFDDLPWASALVPPLTTVRQPMREMAAKAVDLLLGRDDGDGAIRLELPTRLVIRGSA